MLAKSDAGFGFGEKKEVTWCFTPCQLTEEEAGKEEEEEEDPPPPP